MCALKIHRLALIFPPMLEGERGSETCGPDPRADNEQESEVHDTARNRHRQEMKLHLVTQEYAWGIEVLRLLQEARLREANRAHAVAQVFGHADAEIEEDGD